MPWIRLWWKGNFRMGEHPAEEEYQHWLGKVKEEDWPLFEDEAESKGNAAFGHLERGFTYGFEVVKKLPPDVCESAC